MISLKSVTQIILKFLNKVQKKYYYKRKAQIIAHYFKTRIKLKKVSLIYITEPRKWMSHDFFIKSVNRLKGM